MVVDAARGAVKGATVTVTLTPLTYGKGNYLFSAGAKAWVQNSTIAGFPNTDCPNEDRNGNGQLDTIASGSLIDEDINSDGLLRELVFTKIPFIMSSSCTNGVAAHEDNHTGTQRRVYRDGGFDWAAG